MTTEMTTYKRADGELIAGEFDWVTDLDYFDDEDQPVELTEERWMRVNVSTHIVFPRGLYSCQVDPDCDEDSVAWVKIDGEWREACKAHDPLEGLVDRP